MQPLLVVFDLNKLLNDVQYRLSYIGLGIVGRGGRWGWGDLFHGLWYCGLIGYLFVLLLKADLCAWREKSEKMCDVTLPKSLCSKV